MQILMGVDEMVLSYETYCYIVRVKYVRDKQLIIIFK